jgi:hypothetical protein
MRSAILIFLATLAFTPASAQGTWLETRMTKAICDSEPTLTVNADRVARRLSLTDPQKAALKDLIDASASALSSAKASLCAAKPDLSTTPGRMAFAEKTAEIKVASLKAVEPKLKAFMTVWMRSRRKRSILADASAASSTGCATRSTKVAGRGEGRRGAMFCKAHQGHMPTTDAS